MRKRFKRGLAGTLAAVVMAASVFPAGYGGFNKQIEKTYAATVSESGAVDQENSEEWSYAILEDGTIELTGYEGDEWNLVIPSQLDGYTVTRIGNYAFEYDYYLENVVVPESVTSIGQYAFYCCDGLDTVEFLGNLTSIGDYAFAGDWNLDYMYLPDSVESIGGYAFEDCYEMLLYCAENSYAHTYAVENDIMWADSEVKWDYSLDADGSIIITGFSGYDTDLVIPSQIDGYDVKCIGDSAFSQKQYIKSVEMPEGLISVGSNAFFNCGRLTSVEFPEGLVEIGYWTFYECDSLESINIPESVATIGIGAFAGCVNIEEIIVADENARYDSRNNCNAIINKTSNELIAGCKSTVIPADVTSIGVYAFDGCTQLSDIELPEGLTSIGEYAFRDCWEIESVVIPEGVTDIGVGAFKGCSSLTSITLPETLTCLNASTFTECTSLVNINLPKNIVSIQDGVFFGCTNLTSVEIPEGTTTLGHYVFYLCGNLKTVTLPDSITSMGEGVFEECYELVALCSNNSYAYSYLVENGIECILQGNVDISGATVTFVDSEYNYEYNGQEKTPVVDVVFDGKTLVEETDYLINYSNNIRPGTATITIIGIGEYKGKLTTTFEIIPRPKRPGVFYFDNSVTQWDIVNVWCWSTDDMWQFENGFYSWPGIELEKDAETGLYVYECADAMDGLSVMFNDMVDFDGWQQTNDESANQACAGKVFVPEGKDADGRWYGEWLSLDVYKNRIDLVDKAVVQLEKTEYSYDGTAKEPKVTITCEGNTLVEGVDYKVAYSKNIFPGTAKVKVTGKEKYKGSVEVNFEITESDYPLYRYYFDNKTTNWDVVNVWCWGSEDDMWQLENGFYSWPGIELEIDEETGFYLYQCTKIPEKGDFYVLFNNAAIGQQVTDASALATVNEGKVLVPTVFDENGRWSGTWKELEDHIEKIDIEKKAEVTLDNAEYIYDGTEKTPVVTVKCDGKVLKEGKNYTVAYNDNVNAGTATVTVTGKGRYTGVTTKTFTIKTVAITEVTLDKTEYTYDGKVKTPAVTVKADGKVLVADTDYTVVYSNNKNSGIATVTVIGKGNYTGELKKEFTINPSAVAGFTYSARSSSAVALKWTKNTSATGYVVEQYKNGKWVAIKTITSNATVSYKATGLSASTANKFRIKAYKTAGSTKLYSGYATKTVNTLPAGVKNFTYSARSSSAVVLKWTKNTSATGYVIEQYKSGKWVKIKTITKNSTTSYKVTGLKASTANKFRIKAYKSYGKTNLYSGYVSKSINTLPAGVKNFTYSARTKNTITLKWAKNTSATGYVIEQYKNGKWVKIKTVTKNSTVSYKVSGLKKTTSYKFRIKAYKSYGSSKLYSGYVTKTIKTK